MAFCDTICDIIVIHSYYPLVIIISPFLFHSIIVIKCSPCPIFDSTNTSEAHSAENCARDTACVVYSQLMKSSLKLTSQACIFNFHLLSSVCGFDAGCSRERDRGNSECVFYTHHQRRALSGRGLRGNTSLIHSSTKTAGSSCPTQFITSS